MKWKWVYTDKYYVRLNISLEPSVNKLLLQISTETSPSPIYFPVY